MDYNYRPPEITYKKIENYKSSRSGKFFVRGYLLGFITEYSTAQDTVRYLRHGSIKFFFNGERKYEKKCNYLLHRWISRAIFYSTVWEYHPQWYSHHRHIPPHRHRPPHPRHDHPRHPFK